MTLRKHICSSVGHSQKRTDPDLVVTKRASLSQHIRDFTLYNPSNSSTFPAYTHMYVRDLSKNEKSLSYLQFT